MDPYSGVEAEISAKSKAHAAETATAAVKSAYKEIQKSKNELDSLDVSVSAELRKIYKAKLQAAKTVYEQAQNELAGLGLQFNPETQTVSKKK